MTKLDIAGSFELPEPGQTASFAGPLGQIDVTRRLDLSQYTAIPGGLIGGAAAFCVHPTFLNNRVWMHTDDWFADILSIGVKTLRGMINPGNAGSRRTLELCREHDVKMIATIIPEDGYDWTKEQVQDRARYLLQWLDVLVGVELMNEPDHQRSGHPPVPSNWPAIIVQQAQWIREILPDTWIVSCSLHADTDNFEQDWTRLGAAGLGSLINSIGLHDYDGGLEPCQDTDWRIGVARAAVGNLPVDVTEYGYTTSINNPANERDPVSEDVARLYGLRGLFDRHVTRGIRYCCRFESHDDPDAEKKITEAGFGVRDCPSLDPATWTDKPEAVMLRTQLAKLIGPAPATPMTFGLGVEVAQPEQVSVLVTQVEGKPPVAWLWRPDARAWDPDTRSEIVVPGVDVTLTTDHAVHTLTVGAGMSCRELTELAA